MAQRHDAEEPTPTRSEEFQQLTIAEVRAHLRLGKTKIYELCRSGDLEVRKFGRATRISRASLYAYIERARRPGDR